MSHNHFQNHRFFKGHTVRWASLFCSLIFLSAWPSTLLGIGDAPVAFARPLNKISPTGWQATASSTKKKTSSRQNKERKTKLQTPKAVVLSKEIRLQAGPAMYTPGETLVFGLSLRGFEGGKSTIWVKADPYDKGSVIVTSHTESVGMAKVIKSVKDRITTALRLSDGTTTAYHADLLFGTRRALVQADFHPNKLSIAYQQVDKEGKANKRRYKKSQKVPMGGVAYDSHAALAMMRSWAPRQQTGVFYGLSGRFLWKTDFRYKGKHTISTKFGKRRAIRYDGFAYRLRTNGTRDTKKNARQWSIWISDDSDRLPLLVTAKTEYGDVAVTLKDYRRPARRARARVASNR